MNVNLNKSDPEIDPQRRKETFTKQDDSLGYDLVDEGYFTPILKYHRYRAMCSYVGVHPLYNFYTRNEMRLARKKEDLLPLLPKYIGKPVTVEHPEIRTNRLAKENFGIEPGWLLYSAINPNTGKPRKSIVGVVYNAFYSEEKHGIVVDFILYSPEYYTQYKYVSHCLGCHFVREDGEYMGEKYDHVMKPYAVDHIAMTNYPNVKDLTRVEIIRD